MKNTTKNKNVPIIRKQMRVADVYRYIVTGETVFINGIKMYHCTENYIDVRFEGEYVVMSYFTRNEKERKEAITKINSKL